MSSLLRNAQFLKTIKGAQFPPSYNVFTMSSPQGRYWIGTLFEPFNAVPTALPVELSIWKGQQETCPTTGRVHLQCIIGSKRALRRTAVQRICGTGHWELTRSGAAETYVHKVKFN